MQKKQIVISESTLITVPLLVLVITLTSWLTNVSSKANANEKQIEEINSTDEGSIKATLKQHGEALASIQGALGIKSQVEK